MYSAFRLLQICYPPAVLVLGKECNRSGDWALSKATPVHIGKSQEERKVQDKIKPGAR